ncbi:hypothetical protein GQ55_6G241700 [Panicum hallii var. hallii]|uniref:Protein kinase domain-containing protein n=1 Tax=Panicum hallii var. hallii TaxID=1504633 RepID=A0A2T7D910_9POAL|nr:hypothetical protein GQ55_6G241700 [Panicum hallii var. hallii]
MERRVVGMISTRSVLFAVAVAAAVLPPPPPVSGAAAATDDDVASSLPGCTSRCGNISIPHPFGVEPGCFLPGLNVTCRNSTSGVPELFLGDGTVQALEISIPNSTVRINATFAYFPGSYGTYDPSLGPNITNGGTWSGALGEPYTLGSWSNKLFVRGCNVQVVVVGDRGRILSSCASLCNWDDDDHGWFTPVTPDCSGVGCCQANIMEERSSYEFKVLRMNGMPGPTSDAVVWIADSEVISSYPTFAGYVPLGRLPAVLDWRINHTTCHGNASSAACHSSHSLCRNSTGGRPAHLCECAQGYEGNPYITNGCKDINECDDLETYPCYGVCSNTEGGHQCQCLPGFEGNASVPFGCKDIDECAHPDRHSCYGLCINMPGTFHCRCKDGTYGDPFTKGGCSSPTVWKIGLGVGGGATFLLLALGAPFITRKIKLHKAKRKKERFFKQNHGLLLQQLVSRKSDIGGRMIITLRDLEKATNKFDPSHKIGGGGHGVVYKGLLDLQVVAIKKSKIIVQREIDDFINEVAILSQINHRNIVKLLGCCLETEVPLLVYEFISNGTLDHHLHLEGTISLSWDDRLRIALEISKALAYLHSAASTPILHRDIKSSNILLDDNLTAKVSDFGASKYIQIDQTGVTTAVQGTIGYLDPMYYYTSRLTDKSDVFSFGVLLIELLTKKKPFVYRSDDGEGLVSHFASLLTQCTLVDIIDPQIIEEEGEAVDEVASLAVKCTKLNGEDRPTMREVEMTLENLRGTKKQIHHNMTSRKKYEKDHYMSSRELTLDTSRQYTMEEEILLSARYPR